MKPGIKFFITVLCLAISLCSLLLLGSFFRIGFLESLFSYSVAVHPLAAVALILAVLSLLLIFIIFFSRTSGLKTEWNKALVQEIETREDVQEKLNESNNFLDAIIENFPDILFVKDACLKYVKINKATAELLNKTHEEMIGKTDPELFSAEEAERITLRDKQILRTGKLSEVYEQPITLGKEIRWLSTRKFPVFDSNNKIAYIVGIARDVTEQKKQQDQINNFYKELELKVQERTEELYKSELRFRSLIENGLDVIKMMDASGTIFFVSRSNERVMGFAVEEMLQTKWEKYIHPEDLDLSVKILKEVLEEPGVPKQNTIRLTHKQGHYIWVEETITNLLHDESVGAIIFNFHEITDKLKTEEEKRQLEQALIEEKIARQKEITQATLDGQEQERTAIGMEIHDNINQILGVVKLYLGLAKSRPEIVSEMINKSEENIVLCIKETRKLSKSLVTTNINKYGLHFAILDLIEDFKETGLKFTYTFDEVKMRELNNKIQFSIYRIIQEQLNNIVKHADAKHVTISISCLNDLLTVIIEDDGKGFDTLSIHRGIGLSNIQNRVELVNGDFEIISAPRKGCTIKASFPS